MVALATQQDAINAVIQFKEPEVHHSTALERVKAFKRAQKQSRVLRRDWGGHSQAHSRE